jgi:fructose 1,6-bisphosphatase
LGFQVANGGISCDENGKPMTADLVNYSTFSWTRREAMDNVVMLRRMGEFEPPRLNEEEME